MYLRGGITDAPFFGHNTNRNKKHPIRGIFYFWRGMILSRPTIYKFRLLQGIYRDFLFAEIKNNNLRSLYVIYI